MENTSYRFSPVVTTETQYLYGEETEKVWSQKREVQALVQHIQVKVKKMMAKNPTEAISTT